MRKALIAALVAGSLLAVGSAAAGGWATVGVSPPPDGIDAGDTWTARVTVLQHGERPLSGIEPTLTIRNGGERMTFPARPTGKPGVYEAKVEFPSRGRWAYAVNDGFVDATHTFAPVTVGTVSDAGFELPSLPVLGGVLLGLAAAAALFAARRARPRPAAASS